MARAQHKLQELSVSLSVALLMISALAGANAAQPREETGFGSNPGNLRMFSYVPANQEPAAPTHRRVAWLQAKSEHVCE